MKNKERKIIQIELAKNNIEHFFNLLESKFNPDFNTKYINEIEKLSQSFNIRLTREQKIKFCKKCKTYFDTNSREIRLDNLNKTKDIICKICGNTRKFKYK